MAQVDLKKCIVKLKDGAGHVLTIKVSEGVLNYSEKKPRKYVKDRGQLSDVNPGDEEPVDAKFDFIWEFITASPGSGMPTPSDFLKQVGEASTYTSSDPNACNPYAVDIEVDYFPDCSPTLNEIITLPDFRYEDLNMEFRSGQISVVGKCNAVSAIVARS